MAQNGKRSTEVSPASISALVREIGEKKLNRRHVVKACEAGTAPRFWCNVRRVSGLGPAGLSAFLALKEPLSPYEISLP